MDVDLNIYRARIGLHRYRLFKLKEFSCFNRFEFVAFLAMLLYQAGDIEKNPVQMITQTMTQHLNHLFQFSR